MDIDTDTEALPYDSTVVTALLCLRLFHVGQRLGSLDMLGPENMTDMPGPAICFLPTRGDRTHVKCAANVGLCLG